MKNSNAVGLILFTVETASIILFLVCGYTVYTILDTLTPDGKGEIPVSLDERTQTATLTFTLNPSNRGILAARISVGFSVSLNDGSYSISNNTSVLLQPGESIDLKLILRMPAATLKQFYEGYGKLEVSTKLSTLNDLVALGLISKTAGGFS